MSSQHLYDGDVIETSFTWVARWTFLICEFWHQNDIETSSDYFLSQEIYLAT